jgi:hypothetical protein
MRAAAEAVMLLFLAADSRGKSPIDDSVTMAGVEDCRIMIFSVDNRQIWRRD